MHAPNLRNWALGSLLGSATLLAATSATAAPTYTVTKVVQTVKPHETDALQQPNVWIASNEGDVEEGAPGNGGITIFQGGSSNVVSRLSLECETAVIPVIDLHGTVWGPAPCGAEGHPRHPHGLDVNERTLKAYVVLEHSGLAWDTTRTLIVPAASADVESGLLVEIDIANPARPRIVRGWLLGHGAEESAVNELNGKVYVGNHEPSTSIGDPARQCFVSVVDPAAASPYRFIDLPGPDQCVQGIGADEPRNRVFGTTHIGQRMYAFDSATDSIAFSVDIRPAFDTFYARAYGLAVPAGWVIHMHDLAVDTVSGRVYQTIHTLGPADAIETDEGTEGGDADAEPADEITGHWVAEVDTANGNQVTIINLDNGSGPAAVARHADYAVAVPFAQRFVHAHFLDVDSTRGALLVSGEHTGNLGVVDIRSRSLQQVLAVSVPVACGDPNPEPHVHGVNINRRTGAAYVSDEGEGGCFLEQVTLLRP